MSTLGEHFWQYGIQCDVAGCKAAIWRIGESEQWTHTLVQADAKKAGWFVTRNRLYGSSDLCPEHAKERGL